MHAVLPLQRNETDMYRDPRVALFFAVIMFLLRAVYRHFMNRHYRKQQNPEHPETVNPEAFTAVTKKDIDLMSEGLAIASLVVVCALGLLTLTLVTERSVPLPDDQAVREHLAGRWSNNGLLSRHVRITDPRFQLHFQDGQQVRIVKTENGVLAYARTLPYALVDKESGTSTLQPYHIYIQGVPILVMVGRKGDLILFEPGRKSLWLTRDWFQ